MSEELEKMTASGELTNEALENEALAPMDTKGVFIDMLKRGNAKIRSDRAQAIGESAELIYKREVEDIATDLKNMIRNRENYLDMSPDSALSLKVATDFNAKEFVSLDIKLSVDIRNLNIMYEIAKKRYVRLFGREIN